jgi:hypothetical protein
VQGIIVPLLSFTPFGFDVITIGGP